MRPRRDAAEYPNDELDTDDNFGASMRPRRDAAEYMQTLHLFDANRKASMRPRRDAAEYRCKKSGFADEPPRFNEAAA